MGTQNRHHSRQSNKEIRVNHIFFNDTATTEIYTRKFVGSVRCVYETGRDTAQGNCNMGRMGNIIT